MFISYFLPRASTNDIFLTFLTANPSPCTLSALVTLSRLYSCTLLLWLSSALLNLHSFSNGSVLSTSLQDTPLFSVLKTPNLILYFLIASTLFLFVCVPLLSLGLKNNLYADCWFPDKISSWSCNIIYPIVSLLTPLECLGTNTLQPLAQSVDYPSVFLMSVNDSTYRSDVQAPKLEAILIICFSSPSYPVYQ